MNDRSELACDCGEHHLLNEFPYSTKVITLVGKPYRGKYAIDAGAVGTVHSWSQYGCPMTVRVEFPFTDECGQVRCSYNPCEIVKVTE